MGWMVAIARARAIDLARRPDIVAERRRARVADNESPGALSRRELTDELKRLLTCIGRLEPDRQRMLLLAYYGAFTREELAGEARYSGQSAQGLAAAQPVRDRAMPDVLSNDESGRAGGRICARHPRLRGAQRRQPRCWKSIHVFRGIVRIWERRLSELHLMVEPVEPDAELLERIKAEVPGDQVRRRYRARGPAPRPRARSRQRRRAKPRPSRRLTGRRGRAGATAAAAPSAAPPAASGPQSPIHAGRHRGG